MCSEPTVLTPRRSPRRRSGKATCHHSGLHGLPLASSSFPCLAVATGCMVARSAGVGPGVWARNVGAWVIGALSMPLVARIRPATLFRTVMLLTPLALLISLFNPGQSGVHRWIVLGPLNWNAAFLFLPPPASHSRRQRGADRDGSCVPHWSYRWNSGFSPMLRSPPRLPLPSLLLSGRRDHMVTILLQRVFCSESPRCLPGLDPTYCRPCPK